MLIPTLDLFSGIGGFSYALKSVCKTVAYCEIDPFCRRVLQHNIQEGLLSKAPIFENVTTLTPVELKVKPVMITAGFPCQDISAAQRDAKGIRGSRSGLFFEVVRLASQMPTIELILLENSNMIKTRGLTTVQKALEQAGFQLKWRIFAASEVGAPHLRKRWFGLAVKTGTRVPDKLATYPQDQWMNSEPVKRLVSNNIDLAKNIDRFHALGNAVVPQVVTHAFNYLRLHSIGKPYVHKRVERPLKLTFCRGRYHKTMWATPVSSSGGWCHKITTRCMSLLPTQVLNEDGTFTDSRKRQDYVAYRINPSFVEYLMGYPIGWTS
jgi:DNA (cytosine-5)-methyltransferase 1